MFEFLQPADRPVVATLESQEVVYAKDQPQYNPLRVLRGNTKNAPVLSRWTLTPQQRGEVVGGADIYFEMYTFGTPLQPVRLAIGFDVDPDYIREQYGLP